MLMVDGSPSADALLHILNVESWMKNLLEFSQFNEGRRGGEKE